MAAPITHIALTEKVFDKHFFHMDKKKFFVGTSVPDIRYLGVLERHETHFRDLNLESIKSEDSFIAGVKFHSYLDEVRERFVVSNNLYTEMLESPYRAQSLKFLEDKLLYNKVGDWGMYTGFFKEVTIDAINFGIGIEDAKKWNNLLVTYFSNKPTPESIVQFVAAIGKPLEMAREINRNVVDIESNINILRAIENLYSRFEELI